jgi:hypothetical protein
MGRAPIVPVVLRRHVNVAIAGRAASDGYVLCGLVLAILVVVRARPPLYESPYTQTTLRARGLVVAVDNSLIQQFASSGRARICKSRSPLANTPGRW